MVLENQSKNIKFPWLIKFLQDKFWGNIETIKINIKVKL